MAATNANVTPHSPACLQQTQSGHAVGAPRPDDGCEDGPVKMSKMKVKSEAVFVCAVLLFTVQQGICATAL